MDAQHAWPLPAQGHLNLDGFSFNHLGGFAGDTGPEMRARGMDWWDNWARRDPGYSPAPYAQLAAAVTGAGDRDAGNEMGAAPGTPSDRHQRHAKGKIYKFSLAFRYLFWPGTTNWRGEVGTTQFKLKGAGKSIRSPVFANPVSLR